MGYWRKILSMFFNHREGEEAPSITPTMEGATMADNREYETVTASGTCGTPRVPEDTDLEFFKKRFRPRFEEWVMEPINRLVSSNDALVGFIFMSCAIDYLSGFWHGESTKGKVGEVYPRFVDSFFPGDLYEAAALYDSLRNGLVHMFTIKEKRYILTHDHPELHLKTRKSGPITQTILNAKDFRDDLVSAKDKYFDAVESDPELLRRFMKRYEDDGFLGPQDIPTKTGA